MPKRTEHVVLHEWESLGPGDPRGKALAGLQLETPHDRALARELTRAGTLGVLELRDGIQLRARSHVGRIALGGLTITIQPKLAQRELLALFRYAFGLRHAARYDSVAYATTGALFADMLIAQLHAEARELLERGLARNYVRTTESLAAPRGALAFGDLARQGGIRRAELPCTHHPRTSDTLLNQVLASGLRFAASMAHDRRLWADIARLATQASELASPIALSFRVLQRAERQINRLLEGYSSVLRIIAALHAGTLLELEDAKGHRQLPGFLFDMNRFWQRLLDRFLRENLPGARVESEHGLTAMMRYVPGHNPRGRRGPTPRPDYAIRRGSRIEALLDAKYRDLWDRSLPREMLYQLALYALSQPGRATAAILFPTGAGEARPSLIEIRDPVSHGSVAFVALRPVRLAQLVEMIEDRSAVGRAHRERFASSLAFGA